MSGSQEAPMDVSAVGAGRLDRDVIVRAALAMIDEDGAHALTMRGVGQALGVEAMSLYRYVTGREDLLEGVVALLLADVRRNLDDPVARTWQGYLQTLAHQVRAVAVRHPAAFPLIATRHPAAPWMRPPLRSLELIEHFVSTLSDRGLTDDQVVATYRAFTSFLIGQLLLEAAIHGADTGPVGIALDEGDATVPNQDGSLDLSGSPVTARLRPALSEDHSSEEFEIALETLLDRLELTVSQ